VLAAGMLAEHSCNWPSRCTCPSAVCWPNPCSPR
jgi:hypothetical protein